MRVLLILAGVIAAGLVSQPAEACNCPKEQLIKAYGSVSMLGGLTKPRPGPLRPVAAETPETAPPLLWPTGEKPRPTWGLADPAADPFAIRLPEP